MFSEYASRYLSKSQRPAPLFEPQSTTHSDVDDYIDDLSGSFGDNSSESDSSSLKSGSESEYGTQNSGAPPMDLLVEHSNNNNHKSKPKHKTGFSLWKNSAKPNLTPGSAAPSNVWPGSTNSANFGSADGSSSTQGLSDGRQPSQSDVGARTGDNCSGDLEANIPYSGKPLDNTIAAIYVLSMATSLATAFLVSFSAPENNGNSSVYPIFVYSAKILLAYAILATIVSTIWLYLVRHCARAMVQVSVFAVPTTLVGTSLISIVMSVHESVGWHGLAHAALRITALVPLGLALLWVLYLRQMKDLMGRASEIVVRSAEVYNECTPMMSILTLCSGVASLVMSGLWSFFLARAFLEGRVGILLGAWLTFMYLWTWGLLCALLHAVLANVTTVWYTKSSMDGVMAASIYGALSFHFSSACTSALVALLVRLPLLILPSRLGSVIQKAVSVILHTTSSRILSPLTLPTAVITRCSLNRAAQSINAPEFLAIDRRAYRLAKLFLVSARACCSLMIGFIAWVHADRVQDVSSVYGYLIALVALFMGWTVMGASENMLSMISDALLVNYVVKVASPRRESLRPLFEDVTPLATDNRVVANMLESEYSDSD